MAVPLNWCAQILFNITVMTAVYLTEKNWPQKKRVYANVGFTAPYGKAENAVCTYIMKQIDIV